LLAQALESAEEAVTDCSVTAWVVAADIRFTGTAKPQVPKARVAAFLKVSRNTYVYNAYVSAQSPSMMTANHVTKGIA
jgi:hypothetical protein